MAKLNYQRQDVQHILRRRFKGTSIKVIKSIISRKKEERQVLLELVFSTESLVLSRSV